MPLGTIDTERSEVKEFIISWIQNPNKILRKTLLSLSCEYTRIQNMRATDEAKDILPEKIGTVMIVKNWGVERGMSAASLA